MNVILMAQAVPQWAQGTWVNTRNRSETLIISAREINITFMGNERHPLRAVNSDGSLSFATYRISRDGNDVLLQNVLSTGSTRSLGKFTMPVTGVAINIPNINIRVGDERNLTVTMIPANASNRNVTWASENRRIATITQDGKVKGIAQGQTKITVTTADGQKTDEKTIVVTPRPTPPIGTTQRDTPTQPQQTPPNWQTWYVRTEDTPLHLRTTQNTNTTGKYQIPRGTEISVDINYQSNAWAKVRYNNEVLYAQKQYVGPTPVEDIFKTMYTITRDTQLRLRTQPDASDDRNIRHGVDRGTPLRVYKDYTNSRWAKIRYNGADFYASREFLSDTMPEDVDNVIKPDGDERRIIISRDFKFTPRQTADWTIKIQNLGTTAGPTITLLNASATQQIATSSGRYASITRNLIGGTQYTIRASHNGNATGNYDLVVEKAPVNPTWATGEWSNNTATLNITENAMHTSIQNQRSTFTRMEGLSTIYFGNNHRIIRGYYNQIHLEIKYTHLDYWVRYTFYRGNRETIPMPPWALGIWTWNRDSITITASEYVSRSTRQTITGRDGEHIIWFGGDIKIQRTSNTTMNVSIRQNNSRNFTNYTFTKQQTRPSSGCASTR